MGINSIGVGPQGVSAGFNFGSSQGFKSRQAGRDSLYFQPRQIDKNMMAQVRAASKYGKQYGFHPLSLMGLNPSSGPSSYIDGQDTSRAQVAIQSSNKDKAFTKGMQDAQLRNAQLKNKLLEQQISRVNSTPGTMDSYSGGLIDGQANGAVRIKPAERTASPKGKPEQDYGHVPDVGFARTRTGLTPVPGKDVKERMEDQFIPEMMWAIRNYGFPSTEPPKKYLPKGAMGWKWNFTKQEWQPRYMGKHKSKGKGPWNTKMHKYRRSGRRN